MSALPRNLNLASYKQWSGPTREARFREYKNARAAGRIPAPGPCEICGQTRGTMHHAEDYGPTLEDYVSALHSLCGRCHAMLHVRFRFPGQWAAYKQKCRTEGGPQPPVKSMSEIYYGVTRDIPPVRYPEGSTWWELLSTARHTGPLL